MAFLWGYALGNVASSAIKTYGDLLKLREAYQGFQDTQAERAAAQNAGNDTSTPVTGQQSDQQILSGIQGNNAEQDPEAAMQGLINVKTASTPQEAQAGMQNARQMQQDFSNANAQPISVPAPVQPPQSPAVAAQAAPAAPSIPPTGGIAPQPTTPSASYASAIANAIGKQESGNNPKSPTSVDGAVGQFQITPATFHAFAHSGENINNPADNAAVGNRIIQTYAQKYNNDPAKVAVAYFSGPGNVNTDPNAKTPWIHDYKDGNGTSTSQYVAGVTRKLGGITKANSFGGTEVQNPAGQGPAVHPDTELTEIKAQPISQGLTDGGAYQFSKDAQGNVTMQKSVTASQRAMAAAQEAFKRGDMKNAGALTQAAMTMQSQEAQQRVNNIVNNTDLSDDQKVAQLAGLSGAKVFKTANGSYLVPGLGPTDANGNPAPMTMPQVQAFATWMSSPEGMVHAMDYQQHVMANQIAERQAATGEKNAATNAAEASSRINLQNQQAEYYGTFKQSQADLHAAQASNQQAQAAERSQQAELQSQWQNLQQKLAQAQADRDAGKLTPEAYKTVRDSLMDQAAMLKNRMPGGGGQQKEAIPMKQDVGAMYRMPDGSLKILHPLLGYADPQVAQTFDRNTQQIQANPSYNGILLVDRNTGMVGLTPEAAAKAGLDPRALYKDAGSAFTAMRMSPKFQSMNAGTGITPSLNNGGLDMPAPIPPQQ